MVAIYDKIGHYYSLTRQTDPRIQQRLLTELRGARRILNIGAGAGSYEPVEANLVAVEPSAKMIAQRKTDSHPVEQACAEKLPFADASFSHAMTVLSMHHWEDRAKAFAEINRVATDKFIAITWDPSAEPFWLTRDYFPQIHSMDMELFPGVSTLAEFFDAVSVTPIPIPEDCLDGFLAAFWKRPQAYLDSSVRQSISAFAKIADPDSGLEKLAADLESGVWEHNNADILSQSELDAGYRLVVARIKR